VDPELCTACETCLERCQMAAGPTMALGATKRLLQSGLTESFEAQMKNESRSLAEMARTADGREGISAFLGKRTPHFKGR